MVVIMISQCLCHNWCGCYQNFERKGYFWISVVKYNANDCVNSPTYHQFLNGRNLKNTIKGKYDSETTDSKTIQVSKNKNEKNKTKVNSKIKVKNNYYSDENYSETEKDSFKNNKKRLKKNLN